MSPVPCLLFTVLYLCLFMFIVFPIFVGCKVGGVRFPGEVGKLAALAGLPYLEVDHLVGLHFRHYLGEPVGQEALHYPLGSLPVHLKT